MIKKMKQIKVLDATGKDMKKVVKQVRHWFSMNPNRKQVKVLYNKTDSTIIMRGEATRLLQ